MPGRRPRLAEIAQPAAYPRRLQPDRRAGGKFEIDRSAARLKRRADRQEAENAVLLVAVKAAVGDALDLLEGNPAQGALERRRAARRLAAALPAKTVGDQHEAAGVAIVGEIAHRNECVLQAGGDYGK